MFLRLPILILLIKMIIATKEPIMDRDRRQISIHYAGTSDIKPGLEHFFKSAVR